MWKLVVFITAIALACLLLPFTLFGLKLAGPFVVATIADWFCHG